MKVMKCIKADKHPNADRLRVYQFQDDAGGVHQIVANLTNVYEVGDFATIAQAGDEVDGHTMADTQTRGVLSQGMALGKVV